MPGTAVFHAEERLDVLAEWVTVAAKRHHGGWHEEVDAGWPAIGAADFNILW